jgi:hypothetical protein
MSTANDSASSGPVPVPESELLSYAREKVWPGFFMQEDVIERFEDYWIGSEEYSLPTHE